MTDADRREPAPYADAAQLYVERGWLSPIPLGRPGERAVKKPVPKGFTGRAGVAPEAEQIEEWRSSHGSNNIGIHLPAGVVGIDCDHYAEKKGRDTLDRLETELGVLPATYRSTARGADNPSGIRFYRVPPELEFAGIIGPGVEIIQRKHRYAAVWPSVHPEGSTYEWYDERQAAELWGPLNGLPDIEDLPELPAAWVERFREGSREPGAPAVSLDKAEAVAWLSVHGQGAPCRAVDLVLRTELGKLNKAITNGTSRYDTAVVGSMALLRLAGEGHHGVRVALRELRDAYHDAVSDVADRDASEWSRMVQDGIAKVAAVTDEDFYELHPSDHCPNLLDVVRPVWPSPRAPHDVAERAVDELWRLDGADAPATLASWRGDFYEWAGTHWRETSEKALRAALYGLLRDAVYRNVTAAGAVMEVPWNPDRAKVSNVLDALAAVVHHDDHDEIAVNDSSEIAFANGVLRLRDRALLPHSPLRFNLAALPFDYDPEAGDAGEWTAFLKSLWPGDEDAIALLQEWIGYLVSGEVTMQKALILIGQRRSGKGTIGKVIAALIGREGSCGPILSSLAGTFGLQPLLGKSSAVIGDARYNARTGSEAIGKLLTIIGDDYVSVPRKNRDDWNGRLGVRFTFLSNEVPGYIDPSGAMAGRFLPLQTFETFYGREDLGLFDRLLDELPAILLWALDGLDRLHGQGHFTEPESSQEIAKSMHEDSSPIRAFLNETCRKVPIDPDGGVDRVLLYAAYRAWCDDEGRVTLAKAAFGSDLRAVFPQAMGNGNPVWRDGKRVRVYYGIELREEWLRRASDGAGDFS